VQVLRKEDRLHQLQRCAPCWHRFCRGAARSSRRRVGENDTLYGSVTSVDIASALAAKGFEIDRRKIVLAEPLKAPVQMPVPIKIHRDRTTQVTLASFQKNRKN